MVTVTIWGSYWYKVTQQYIIHIDHGINDQMWSTKENQDQAELIGSSQFWVYVFLFLGLLTSWYPQQQISWKFHVRPERILMSNSCLIIGCAW